MSYGMGKATPVTTRLQRSEPQIFAEAAQLVEAGDLGRADGLLRELLDRRPDHPLALHELGRIANRLGDPARAVELIGRAVDADPSMPIFHLNLGNALSSLGKSVEAIEAFQRSAELAPAMPEAHYNLGLALFQEHRVDEAADAFKEALSKRPGYVRPMVALATISQAGGDMENARALLDQALEIEPDNVAALGLRVALDPAEIDSPYFNKLEAVLEEPVRSPDDRNRAAFALAKMYDDIGDYKRAFEAAEAGNQARRAMPDMASSTADLDRFEQFVDRTIELIDRPFLDSQSSGTASERPIFIVGMPRSGSTLIESILAAHPDISAGGEALWLERSKQRAEENLGMPYPDCASAMSGDLAGNLGEHYLAQQGASVGDAKRLTDKMLLNFQLLGLVAQILPNARVVHCLRDPRDTCLSCFMTNFTDGLPYTTDLEQLIRFYRAYERLMDHWRVALPLSMMEVYYEDLVSDQESESKALIEFCDLPWDEACLNFQSAAGYVLTASDRQVRQEVYQTSVGRWRQYADHLGPALDAFGRD